jgi:hypothetical protein
MAKQAKSRSRVKLDVPHAVKRALMYRGFIISAPEVPNSTKPEKKPAPKRQISLHTPETEVPSEQQEVQERLIDITVKAQDILYRADTVFPFTLFPNTITLDREKLTVATRTFFRTARIISVPIDSISSAEVSVGPFFGSLHMASKYFVQNTYLVNFLTRSDAMKIEHLMQGFIIAHDKKVDLTDIEKEDLLILLDDLGQGVTE